MRSSISAVIPAHAGIPEIWLLAWSLCFPLAALAQPASKGPERAYPEKSIRVIVGFAPSGGTDIAARILGKKLAEQLGQPIVIDNRPGAGGTIGDALAAVAPPDGYTLLMTANGPHAIAPSLYPSLPYNIFKDYAAISLVSANPYVLIVHPAVPANSVRELIAWLKTNPHRANYSSAGNGTPAHLAGELFKSMAGVNMTHVPYKGAAPALANLMAGEVNVLFSEMIAVTPHLTGGKLRALAVTTSARSAFVPDLPTIAESGLAGYDVYVWYGLLAPAGTPQFVVARLNAEVGRALNNQEMKDQFTRSGSTVAPSTPAAFDAVIKRDYETWARVIKTAGIKLE